jgi:hypothetical protein
LRAQLINLQSKSSRLAGHAPFVQRSRSGEGPPRFIYGLSHDAMVGEYVFSSAHNSGLTPEFATSFCPSYFVAQQASVAPRVHATRQVIHTDGLAFGPSPITKARGVRVIMPQFFCPLNTEEE